MSFTNYREERNAHGSLRTVADITCDGPTCTNGEDGETSVVDVSDDAYGEWASFDDFDGQGSSHFCTEACAAAWARKRFAGVTA